MPSPKISTVAKVGYLAGQAAYRVNVTYPGEDPRPVVFVGPLGDYGPVVMVTRDNAQTFVTNPGRFGVFGPEWVRRFFEGGSS